jgi:glycerol-3-phosphate acyltransferase PlsY
MLWLFHLYPPAAVLGYLLGSIPTGHIVGRCYGIDIRSHGSGNIGATNVARVLGKKPGLLVFVCDTSKGFVAVHLAYALVWATYVPGANGLLFYGHHTFGHDPSIFPPNTILESIIRAPWYDSSTAVLAAIACILGHNFPIWLGFRGGKGIATTTGVLLGLMPAAVGISAVVWAAVFFALRYVSLASLIAALTLPVTVGLLWWDGRANIALFWFSVAAMALAFWRHRANIQRLLAGTEPRFVAKGSANKS